MALRVDNIDIFYGNSQALHGMSMEIPAGAAVALLGRNGMGKTTTVQAIIGALACARGEITYHGEKLTPLRAFERARRGIAVAPEGRQIFPNLNVRENLIAAAANYNASPTPWTIDSALVLFPPLKKRLNNMGNQLSGGEQQMLSIARALMLNPSLLILDEATEGLAPLVRQTIWQKLREIKRTGIALLLIDKNLDELSRIADYYYIIEKGAIAWHGAATAWQKTPALKAKYLGI